MTARRRAQIVRLLETRDDHLPQPAARPLSTAGFVHRSPVRESCPDCLCNGFVSAGCETCHGRGYVEGRRQRDPYDTGQQLGVFAEGRRHEAAHERDRQLARLEEQVRPPRTEADIAATVRAEPWEVDREQRWAEFDYAALDVALDELRLFDGSAYRELHVEFVYAVRRGASGAIERGLAFLSGRLPDPLRAPKPEPEAQAAVAPLLAGKQRDREIRRLVRDGNASQWVAGRFGLSVSQVYRVVNKRGNEEAA